MSTFDSCNPVTGLSIGQHALSSKEDVDAAVASAREVAPFWKALDFKGRKKALLQWNSYLLENLDDLVEIVSLETGKPISDATLEASLALAHLGWAARQAEEVLRTSYRSPGLLMANMSATVERSPLGAVSYTHLTLPTKRIV